eukprot:scaffold10412_cov107-Isochrysis_galbana.AAC.2
MASSCTIKLVGPDLPVDGLKCTIELTGNIGQLRASAFAQLPAPTGGATLPRLEQLRVIHQGRFQPDEKLIKGESLRRRYGATLTARAAHALLDRLGVWT